MNKIVIRSVLITLIAGALLLILFRNRSPFGRSNTSFASRPVKEITRIEFSEKGRKLSLEKKGENWLINGESETRKSGILFIIRVLREMKIKSPVSSELFKSEITGKGITSVRVRVYEKRKLIRTFLVYRTHSNIYGNIMKMGEGFKPFIVYVPGYDGDIASAFTLNELFWQPYTVFNLMPSEIISVDFKNYSDTASSFSIVNQNHLSAGTGSTRDLTGGDSVLVARYLSYFTWIPFEQWAFEIGAEEKRVIESQQPLYRITVNAADGKQTVLTLWEKTRDENGKKTKDSDRLYGKTDSGDEYFIIRYFDIDPLIKKRSYFFPE
jgi:hypothetical protein